MAKLDLLGLLEDLTRLSAFAEFANAERFARGFHLVPAHLKAFEPNVLLVLGGRGSGKSYLFRAATECNLASDLRRVVPSLQLPENVTWVAGYTNSGKDLPDYLTLSKGFKKNPSSAQDFWLGALVRSLKIEFPLKIQKNHKQLFDMKGSDFDEWLQYVDDHRQNLIKELDDLDRNLEIQDRQLLVGYDELDTLVDEDPGRTGQALQGLISFWARLHRRWSFIRPKLFLRTDLFRHFSSGGGADLAKLAANRVEIRWDDLSLHGMLLKQLLNLEHPQWAAFLGLKSWKEDKVFGRLLELKTPKDYRVAYQSIIGNYMGEGPRKGTTHRWLVDHIKDGNGSAHPRALVQLIQMAATKQVQTRELPPRKTDQPQTLLRPLHVRRSLEELSRDQVNQMKDLWAWLGGLRTMASGKSVPVEEEQWLKWLDESWARCWPKPPNRDPERFLLELLDIGVLRRRPDGRIDAPDIYLDGLKLRRKGGVRKRD